MSQVKSLGELIQDILIPSATSDRIKAELRYILLKAFQDYRDSWELEPVFYSLRVNQIITDHTDKIIDCFTK